MRAILFALISFAFVGVADAATVLKKTANADGTYTLLTSQNRPDFSPSVWWISAPGSPVLAGTAGLISGNVPRKHWKPDGSGGLAEMTAGEKTGVDAFAKPTGQTFHLKSGDGSVWLIIISNAGAVSGSKI